jgi:hypothetical protein
MNISCMAASVTHEMPVDGATPPPTPAEEGANLIAFVGQKIHVLPVEREPEPTVIGHPRVRLMDLDLEFAARYRVLEVIYGRFPAEEIEFTAFDHFGNPAFAQHEYAMLYVSWHEGKLYHQKYLFHAVHRTADGRWAGCGDPYAGAEVHRGNVKPVPIDFDPPVTFPLANLGADDIERRFPAEYFHRDQDVAVCSHGSYTDDLFLVMRDGYLTARGVFQAGAPE